MDTRKLVFAAAGLLGAAVVVAQVEPPGDIAPDASMERSTSTMEGPAGEARREQDAREEGDDYSSPASTTTRDASGARPPGEEDAGRPEDATEPDAGTEAESDAVSPDDTRTTPQKP